MKARLPSPLTVPPSTPADTPTLPSLAVPPSTTVATPDVVPVSAKLPTFSLQHLHETLKLPNSSWCDQSPNPLTSCAQFTGEVVGFTNLGNINDELLHLEKVCLGDEEHPPVATHLLVLMVRGIFFKLNFPYAHFATEGVTADLLFPIVWEAVLQIESVGLKVIFITADGASPNRKFFRMHEEVEKSTFTYKTRNRYAEEGRFIFFFC